MGARRREKDQGIKENGPCDLKDIQAAGCKLRPPTRGGSVMSQAFGLLEIKSLE